jgi:hypothetical protein
MKNLLNNISSDEKQRILEQHSGGKLIDTRNFRRLLESKLGDVKPLIIEQEVKQGAAGDQYQYKKEGGKYFYAKKSEGTNAKWVEQTKDEGIKAIATKIFGDPAPSKTQPTAKPLDQKTQTNTTTNTNTQTAVPTNTTTNTTVPTNTNQSANTNQPANTNTTIPTKIGSLVGKSYTFENKTCVIEKEIKIGEGSYIILPNQGCRKTRGVVDKQGGYLSLSLNDDGTSGSLMTWFEYDTKSKSYVEEPRTSLATIYLK